MRNRFLPVILAAVLLVILFLQPVWGVGLLDNQKQELAEKITRQVVAGMPSWADTDEEKAMYLYDPSAAAKKSK